MKPNMDPAQYGNQKGVSTQHYFIDMIQRILTVLDNNSKGDTFAVIANMIDWNNAFILHLVTRTLVLTLIDKLNQRKRQVSPKTLYFR